MARKRKKNSKSSFGNLGFTPNGPEEKALRRLLDKKGISLLRLLRELVLNYIKRNGEI